MPTSVSRPSAWGAADGLLVLEDPDPGVPAPERVVAVLQDLLGKKQARW